MKKQILYLAVTADEYELPMIVEDRAVTLAQKLGLTRDAIYSAINYNYSGKITGYRIIKIELEDD